MRDGRNSTSQTAALMNPDVSHHLLYIHRNRVYKEITVNKSRLCGLNRNNDLKEKYMEKQKVTKNIFMIGFMGSGKSSVSLQLADMTGLPKAEMDQILVDREQMSIADIFAEKGEPYFRAQETELLKEFGSTGPQIVSCGGGVAMNEENVDEMRRTGKIICLTATPDVIYERVKDSRERPILNGNMNVEYIAGLMEARRPFYEKAASVIIDTSHMRIDQVAEAVLAAVSAAE